MRGRSAKVADDILREAAAAYNGVTHTELPMAVRVPVSSAGWVPGGARVEMPLSPKDHLGRRGENIAFVRLTEVCQANDLPYFVPHFLGDKCPLFDALVELVGAGGKTPYFFAQVKATREGYNTKGRLKVQVEKSDVIGIVQYPAPTYVIGIDELQEKAFIVAVYGGMNMKISSLNTTHELNATTLKLLWEEVRGYWKDKDMARNDSHFKN